MILDVAVEDVKIENPVFDINSIKARLKPSRQYSWFRPTILYDDAITQVRRFAPIGPDIVEWMQETAAINSLIDVMVQNYSAFGGDLRFGSNDPAIPGLRVEDMYLESIPNEVLVSRGYATVTTSIGTFNVPVDSKLLIAKGNYLGLAAARRGQIFQWIGILLKWLKMAVASRTESISDIPFVQAAAFTMPNFFQINPPIGARHIDYVVVESDRPQTLYIDFRSPSDFGTIYNSVKVNIGSGETTIRIRVFGFGSYVMGIFPQDGTAVNLKTLAVRRV